MTAEKWAGAKAQLREELEAELDEARNAFSEAQARAPYLEIKARLWCDLNPKHERAITASDESQSNEALIAALAEEVRVLERALRRLPAISRPGA
jgi:hypothetical protein